MTTPASELAGLVGKYLANTTATVPVEWTNIIKVFGPEENKQKMETLLEAMRFLLVPAGPIRGQNGKYWHEPLPANWRAIPAYEPR